MSISKAPSGVQPSVRPLVLLTLGVWIASLPVAEFVFRLLGQQTTTNFAGLYQPFGDGGYRLRANVAGSGDTLQGRYSIATNTLGLRCAPEHAGETPRNIDILVLGDSQAFGAGLSFRDTLVGQLAAKAEAQGLRVENAAVGAHFLENQLELAQWLDAHGLRARRILLLLTPYLIATAGEYKRASVGSDGRLYEPSQRATVTSWLKRHTVVYGRLRNTVNAFLPLGKDEQTPLAVKIYLNEKEPTYRDKALRSLEALSRWANQYGATLTIAYTPMAVEVAFDVVRQSAAGIPGGVDPNVPFEAAQSAANALGVAFYDLRPTLVRRAAEHRVLTLPADAHYNAATSAECAGSIWAALAGSATGVTATTATSQGAGSAQPSPDHAHGAQPDEAPNTLRAGRPGDKGTER